MDTNTDNLLNEAKALIQKNENLLPQAERYYFDKRIQDACEELHIILDLFTPILQEIKVKDEVIAQERDNLKKITEEITLLRSKLTDAESNAIFKGSQDYFKLKQDNEALEDIIVNIEKQMLKVTTGRKEIQSQKASLAKEKEELEVIETKIEQKKSELESLSTEIAELEKKHHDFESGATEDFFKTNTSKVRKWNDTLRSQLTELNSLMKGFQLPGDAFDNLLVQETFSPTLPNSTSKKTEVNPASETTSTEGTSSKKRRFDI